MKTIELQLPDELEADKQELKTFLLLNFLKQEDLQ